jgi:hypothetical protein
MKKVQAILDWPVLSGHYNGVNYRRTWSTISCNNHWRTSPIISWDLPINNYTQLPRLSLEQPVILKHSHSPESTSSQEWSISLEPSQVQNHPKKSRSRSLTRLEYIWAEGQRRRDGNSTRWLISLRSRISTSLEDVRVRKSEEESERSVLAIQA